MNIISTPKILVTCAIMAALISFCCVTAQVAANEYKHIPTSREELNNAERDLKVLKKRYPDIEESTFITDNIQAPLIKNNPDLLKKAIKKHDDGLRKVYIIGKKSPESIGKGIFTISAGNIALTQGLINAEMALEPGSYAPKPNKDYDVYAISSLAVDYAKEAARWYYNDDKAQMDNNADEFAVTLLENVPTLSIGGKIMSDQRWQATLGNIPSFEADETAKSLENNEGKAANSYDTYGHIMGISQNRVGFTYDDISTNQLLVADRNGDYWSVFAPPQFDVAKLEAEAKAEEKSIMTRGEDRAYYAAGQIAWAIENDAWDSSHVEMADAHKYFKDLPKDIKFTAVIAKTDKDSWKLIDWYLDDSSYLTEKQQEDLNSYIDGMKASFNDAENW